MLPRQVWNKRPFEIRNLLNPAFCSVVLFKSMKAYHEKLGIGMPYPLVFLILPMVLPEQIRNSIPQRIDINLKEWILNSNIKTYNFDENVKFLSPFTREAIMFGMSYNIFRIERSSFLPYRDLSNIIINKEKDETTDCFKKAESVGKWFSYIDSVSTVFRTLGVRP